MRYVSTRGNSASASFEEVLLTGLAPDGGLYIPCEWPKLPDVDLQKMTSMPYEQIAFKVMRPFVGDVISENNFMEIIQKSYTAFNSDSPAPLRDLGKGLWLLELFHGPTLAFKDIAMQFLGEMFEYILTKRNERITIIGATSGDTGSAAIEAVKGKDMIDIFMLHPANRVSAVQRRQMTCVTDTNVYNIAVDGTFDDCQNLVKSIFNDSEFTKRHSLSAVNSINWARIMAQIVYYVSSAIKLKAIKTPISFSVPTGNFGNVFAGFAALKMGIPIQTLLVSSNTNDILPRFFKSGEMKLDQVHATVSPSMDIQVSSNFERLLFELSNRNGSRVKEYMEAFNLRGKYQVTTQELAASKNIFHSASYNDKQTIAEMLYWFEKTGMQIDPHTAVALLAARENRSHVSEPMIVISTAHPAKFNTVVEQATGNPAILPNSIESLLNQHEYYSKLPNNVMYIKNFINDMLEST